MEVVAMVVAAVASQLQPRCAWEVCNRLPSWHRRRVHHNGTGYVAAIPQRVLYDTST
jgi:hypothetical protein